MMLQVDRYLVSIGADYECQGLTDRPAVELQLLQKPSAQDNISSNSASTQKMVPLHPSPQPAASANQLPTLHSATADRRSASYTSPANDHESSPAKYVSPRSNIDIQIREYHNSIKATLTALLNDQRVRKNPDGSKCVQSFLLEAERNLRKEKRKSIGSRPPDEKL
ncbi:hypothetical protein EMGR_005540 [Emarellia grisea]